MPPLDKPESLADCNFRVVIDDTYLKLCADKKTSPVSNKNILSLLNGFEDGGWRFENFQNFVWDNIAQTSLTHRERESLAGTPHTLLREAAKNLRFTDKEKNKGSELAEIILYGIMKKHYGALPVVPKIFYKQNTQDNAKGADSVHIIIDQFSDFSIWFGEAKFYSSIENTRLSEIIKSVGASIETNKLKKENSIITNVSDIDDIVQDKSLLTEIKSALANRHSIDDLKPKLNIPILLLHQCDVTASAAEMSDEYIAQIREQHKDRATAYFSRQATKLAATVHKYDEITFHLILFPVPKKQQIVEQFIASVKHYKGL